MAKYGLDRCNEETKQLSIFQKLHKVPSYLRKLRQEGDKRGVKGLEGSIRLKRNCQCLCSKRNQKIEHMQKFMNRSFTAKYHFFLLV